MLGIIIGKRGEEIENLKKAIEKIVRKSTQINIKEVKKPDLDATILAEGVAQQLERRVMFRRAMLSFTLSNKIYKEGKIMQTSVIDLLVPTDIQVDDAGLNVSKVTLEPLERGFGHTLGNALRRILLSSMPGAAVTDATIEGVAHEYSTIEGVREDVIDILLNLKDLPVKVIEGTSATLVLDIAGPCEVSAASFEVPGNVELVDPEHHIATIVDKVPLKMSVTVQTGRGYEPADSRDDEDSSIGALKVDASFSPVRRVAYSIDNARFEKRTDLDKLIIELETDGTIDPKMAIEHCANRS